MSARTNIHNKLRLQRHWPDKTFFFLLEKLVCQKIKKSQWKKLLWVTWHYQSEYYCCCWQVYIVLLVYLQSIYCFFIRIQVWKQHATLNETNLSIWLKQMSKFGNSFLEGYHNFIFQPFAFIHFAYILVNPAFIDRDRDRILLQQKVHCWTSAVSFKVIISTTSTYLSGMNV